MAHPFLQLDKSNLLRLEAEVQLENGAANPSFNWPVSMDTLHSLLGQTLSGEGAEVSLKVLHELQVFQVELDLMHNQMASNEQLLAEDLQLYGAVFEQLPQPCFILNATGLVHSSNHAAADFAGREWCGRDHLTGVSLLSLLVKESQLLLHAALLRLQAGSRREPQWLQFQGQPEPQAWLVTQLPGKHFILMKTEVKN
ncbi:hypothetical protein A5320_17175 [Rheinheimera sp. SA_1]|uniref:hypothetical protein n=1 Tax=Rheinheimera sp. SA_1 TaxID=1827365 RepID=UPI0007FF298B|nr:hypothetical protein [Rheinheimera sp. SA_1]OBP13656.1 hypothetical protein A5320_17175 [Rheinheimera sp. SA_1]